MKMKMVMMITGRMRNRITAKPATVIIKTTNNLITKMKTHLILETTDKAGTVIIKATNSLIIRTDRLTVKTTEMMTAMMMTGNR